MQVEQITWSEPDGWASPSALSDAQLVLVFGDRAALAAGRFTSSLTGRWPNAAVIGCSTAGQIHGTEVFNDGLIATAVRFDHTRVRIATAPVSAGTSAAAGAALAGKLAAPDLVHILIISEGLDINGEALVVASPRRRRRNFQRGRSCGHADRSTAGVQPPTDSLA